MLNFEFAKILVKGSRLKRSAIAEAMDVSTATLTLYLNGHMPCPRLRAEKLAQVLNVPESDLWTEETLDTKKAS